MVSAKRHPTMLDLAKMEGADGKFQAIVEIVAEENEVLEDAVVIEANDKSSHLNTVRVGYSKPSWRRTYKGVHPTTGTTAQIRDTIGELADYFEVDKKLADRSGDKAQLMLNANADKMHAFGIEVAGTVFNGNEESEPEAFTGLGPRFDSKAADVPTGEHILQGPASGSPAWRSMYIIGWGPAAVHLIYPQGSKAGLDIRNLGEDTTSDDDGALYQVYRSHFTWEVGMSVVDWRYVVRIQYDENGLTKDASSGADLLDLISQGIEMLPQGAVTRKALYVNPRARSFFRRQITNKLSGSTLSYEQVAGKRVMMLDELPVRRCDALKAGETLIT